MGLIYNCPSIFLSEGIPSSAPPTPHLHESQLPSSKLSSPDSGCCSAVLFRLLVPGVEPGLRLLSKIPGKRSPQWSCAWPSLCVPCSFSSVDPKHILILRRFLLGCVHTVGGRKNTPPLGRCLMYSTDDMCFNLTASIICSAESKNMQMFLVKLFLRFCICKTEGSVREDWKEQDGDSQRWGRFYIWLWHGCFLGGSREVTHPLWASQGSLE